MIEDCSDVTCSYKRSERACSSAKAAISHNWLTSILELYTSRSLANCSMSVLVDTDLEVTLTELTVGQKPEHGRHEDWDEAGDRQGEL